MRKRQSIRLHKNALASQTDSFLVLCTDAGPQPRSSYNHADFHNDKNHGPLQGITSLQSAITFAPSDECFLNRADVSLDDHVSRQIDLNSWKVQEFVS